ncbi:tudor domain-containing protein 7A [Mugil cephalus]|uniref:tudor domain-containing protein 7A n=1 Tax=Mugil cephalus TaxID=48193 RepID=UPI001FB661DE|nr:tudor domain-containing protein 7A [Mugil cephalus]
MSDTESIKKMLRAVLQSSKGGVSITSLQSDYRSLCGESIPLKKLGFTKLEDYLRTIPSVVRLEFCKGELKCYAAVCKETAHIAELVARQKSSKKAGHSQVVNCKMRFKPSNPYMLNIKPRSCLRQPSAGCTKSPVNRPLLHGGQRGFSASGDYRQLDQKLSVITPVEHRPPAPQPSVKQDCNRREKEVVNPRNPTEMSPEHVSRPSQSQFSTYDVQLVQSRISQLLKKYCNGLWMSKLSEVYSKMYNQKLHPQVLKDMEKWTDICMVEQPSITNRADRLIYPPLTPKPATVPSKSAVNSCPASPVNISPVTDAVSSNPSALPLSTPLFPSPVPQPRVSPKSLLSKATFVFPPQPDVSAVKLRSPAKNPAVAPRLPSHIDRAVRASGGCKEDHILPTATIGHGQHTEPLSPTQPSLTSTNSPAVASSTFLQPDRDILPLLKVTSPQPSHPAPCPPSSTVVVTAEVRQRIKELLSKYSHGLWAHALPTLFMDTYKTPFPQYVLDNLSLLLDICNVEYPLPHDKQKAILYNSSRADMGPANGQESQQCSSYPLPSGLEVLGPVVPPCLVLPSEQYPSVLVTEAKSSNAVTIRYVGENYSNAQEAMEEVMHSFYNQSPTQRPLTSPTVGQLVAVRGAEGQEFARAQVMKVVAPGKIKVYYMDYGFSVETSENHLLELHQDFLSLPFQATNVRVAGLEGFSSHLLLLSSLEKLAVGKILLMETLEPCQQNEIPAAVFYDTSQDDDVNINSACLKALQDKTMNNPLTVNVTYGDVCVTNVCPDGLIHCLLPSRGTARLNKLLEETDAYFKSQITSESLVSRPFSGKFCLARHKGNWARAEITNMYGNRVMEISFIDLGVSTTVEVTDLREIPPPFLQSFTVIPPQAIKCRLADLTVPEGDWSPEAVLWLKEAVLVSGDCKMKILKLDQHKGDKLVYMYLFIGVDSQELQKSVNHQLAQSELWQKLTSKNVTSSSSSGDSGLTALVEGLSLSSVIKASAQPCHRTEEEAATKTGVQPLTVPPPLELPQPGQTIDVFVSVACHPGYFVLQPWEGLHKLVVLMGEMILYYNQTNTTTDIQKGGLYAAKIDKDWHRVQVKGFLSNGLVSVYELDRGKHELVHSSSIRPLIEEFRQLPFQTVTAQLAGVIQHQWSEEASMLFRNHVEKRALVALVESVQEMSEAKCEPWERKLTVYLVDTTLEDRDLWVHTIMADIDGELSSAA